MAPSRDETQPCCRGDDHSEYVSQGKVITIGDELPAYVVGSGSKGVVVNMDIFGLEMGGTREFCDKLAAAGFNVILPDYFRGNPWSEARYPITDKNEFMNWITPYCDVKKEVEYSLNYLKEQQCNSFGTVGFCYGGMVSFKFFGQYDEVKAISILHGSFVQDDDAPNVKPVVQLLDSKDEPDRTTMNEILGKKFGDNYEYKRFNTMDHGWSIRGDRSNADIQKERDQAYVMTETFLKKHL